MALKKRRDKLFAEHGPLDTEWKKCKDNLFPRKTMMSKTAQKVYKSPPADLKGSISFKHILDTENCRTGPYITLDGKRAFTGFWYKHKPWRGKEILDNGEYYYGEFKISEGVRSGFGRCFHADGDITYSKWLDGKPTGLGGEKIEIDPETLGVATRYLGAFLNGFRDGTGIETYADGGKYNGKWARGMKQGKGTYTYPDMSKITCLFHENEIPDQEDGVKWSWPDEVHKKKFKEYSGGWVGGKFSGKKCTLQHWRMNDWKKHSGVKYKYVGEMVNGKYHGQGKVSWDNDTKNYEGEFANGKQHGKGKYGINKSGSMKYKTGVWDNNKRISWDDDEKKE